MIIGLVILVAIAAGAYYVLVMAPAASAAPPVPSQPIAPPDLNTTPSNPIPRAAGPIDCGNDMGCFAQASSACRPAKMIRNSSVDLFGVIVMGSTYMEIQTASETGKCLLYSLTADSSAKLNNSVVAAALANGASMDDIKKQEAESARQAKAAIGLSGTCKYGAAELSAMLTRWNAGKFASSDYAGADCTGKIFEGVGYSQGGFSANLTFLNSTFGAINQSIKTNTTVKTNATIKANTTISNSTKTNAANKTNAAGTSKTNATATAPKANATNSANNSSAAAAFKYANKYTAYFPEHLAWFCTDRNTEFYRMHWTDYFGGGCSVQKPSEGYVNFSDYVATGCTLIPCCINGPDSEYSRSYDYFECGYN